MKLFEKISSSLFSAYINFVYRTSKINISGDSGLLFGENTDKKNYIVSFWHGESYCLYPLLEGRDQFILTTKDPRGDYITSICHHFGYSTIRIPDVLEDGKYVQRIKSELARNNGGNLVITLDGPLGPLHEPKEFPFFMGLILNYKLLPISVTVMNKIRLTRRWDNYIIPLPFNRLEFYFHKPVAIERKDLKDHFGSRRLLIKTQLETYEQTQCD